MNKDFFNPLKEPLTNDPVLLCVMILAGAIITLVACSFNFLPLVILLSLATIFVAILAYCHVKKRVINRQVKHGSFI